MRPAAAFPAKNARAKRSAFERWFSEGAAFSARRISYAAFATGRIELAAGATHGNSGNEAGRGATGFFLAGESRRNSFGRPERRRRFIGRNDRADAGKRGGVERKVPGRARQQRRSNAIGHAGIPADL